VCVSKICHVVTTSNCRSNKGQSLNKGMFVIRGKSKCTITWNAES